MADDQNQNPPQNDEVKETNESKPEITKLEAVRTARELKNEGSNWTILQEIMQEIQASYLVVDAKTMPDAVKLTEQLKEEVAKRYEDEPNKRQTLLDGVPHVRSIRQWFKKEGWDEAVWSKIRTDQLFSSEKRAEVIESLRLRAIKRSDVAAKLWLTMSGDYSEKMEVNDKTIETFREINSIILGKNKKDSEQSKESYECYE